MTRLVRSLALLIASLGPGAALAQPQPSAPSPPLPALEQAQSFVNEAAKAFAAKEFGRALTALRKAEAIAAEAQDPALARIRFNIARCFEELEQPRKAMEAYEIYLELPDDSHRKERAWEALRRIRSQVFGTLSVACAPPGSLVEIAGLIDGSQSCPWKSDRVQPGAYAVKISHPGYESTIETVDIEAGKPVNVSASLKALAPAPAPAPSVAGSPPPPPGRSVGPWPWLTMGAGLVVAASGGFFTQAAIEDRDEIEVLAPGPERDSVEDDFNFNRTLSYTMYGLGAALAVGGFVWWLIDFLDDEPTIETAAEDAPSVEANPFGLAVRF